MIARFYRQGRVDHNEDFTAAAAGEPAPIATIEAASQAQICSAWCLMWSSMNDEMK